MESNQTNEETKQTNVKTEDNIAIKLIIWLFLLAVLIYCSVINRVVIISGGETSCYNGYKLLTKKDINLQVGYYIGEKQCKTSAEFLASSVLIEMAKSYKP